MTLFDSFSRTDATPSRYGETRFQFLDRSASAYFGHVRDLLEDWLSHVPQDSRSDLVGRLRSGNLQHEAAFWELYLHEAYVRSGFTVVLHPEVAGVTTHPDFRVDNGASHFYLEAVSVGQSPASVAEERRLQDVYAVLNEMRIFDFTIGLEHYGIGDRPLATKGLRNSLRRWIEALDPDVVREQISTSGDHAFASVPEHEWTDDGWSLVFQAFPLKESTRGAPRRALGMMGPGEATMVDNVTGLRRAIDSKYGKYGTLEAPLVIAVQSNTEYPTYDHDVERVLYGLGPRNPTDPARAATELFEEGFWFTRKGWRRRDCPQVISVYGLVPWTIGIANPRVWSTDEPGQILPRQPDWLSPMIIDTQSRPERTSDMPAHFGIDRSWLDTSADFETD